MKRTLFIVGVLLLAAGAWIYLSPRLAAKHFRDAALAGDTAALKELVDFPAVREHLTADLKASPAGRASLNDPDNPLGTALGAGARGLMIEGVVARVVSPSGIAALARYGGTDSSSLVQPELVTMGYRDPATFGVTMRNAARPGDKTVTFIFERSGLSWRLVRLEIPLAQ